MRMSEIIAAAALATVLPLSANANPASGEPGKESPIPVNLTPAQVEQFCKPGAMLLTAEQCKTITKIKEAAKRPTYHLPRLSEYVFPPSSLCSPIDKTLFVRADPLDNFHYALDSQVDLSTGIVTPGGNDSTKGLSINYTDNIQANTQTATINGRISYLLMGGVCDAPPPGNTNETFVAGLGFAPFVSSNGTWNEPLTATATGKTSAGKTITITTTKTSNNALRGGADLLLHLSTGNFPLLKENYFYASPFYQTDYRGQAQIEGLTLAWEPVSADLLLSSGYYIPDLQSIFYWQFRGETEFTQVSNPGLTKFVKGAHTLIGEEVRPHLELFPLVSGVEYGELFDRYVAGRLSLIGTQQFYWDAADGKAAPYYSAVLQYKLGECKVDTKNVDLACSIQGSSSISFEYDWGRDKDTFVKTNQILAKLGYSY